MKLESGTTISHYKILSSIGKGGMGEVYLAQDTKLNRKVAIKFLADEFNRDSDKLNRFVQEAQAASALNHPNIVTIFEIGEAKGSRYIALEYIEGETLTRFLGKKLTFDSALDIAIQLASALDAAHSAGIVHRDIKPDNVMIRPDGVVKILDFGIAKLTATDTTADGSIDTEGETAVQVNTSPGMIIGTANYMSPEQAKGKEIDSRTDIFSLGVLIYEMIAGQLPFSGDNPLEIIGSIIHKEPKPIGSEDVPAELQRIVSKSLRKDPDQRYQTMKGLLADLKEVKREMDFQDQLDRTVQPEKSESATQVFQATTAAEAQQTTTAHTKNDSISIKRSSFGMVMAVIAAILIISALGVGYWYYSGGGASQIDSIAVMPFQNSSTSSDAEYLSDGLVESLIYRLSRIQDLDVSPTSSVFRYKGNHIDPIKSGEELGVQAVMTGRIAQRGEDLIVSVELIDVRNSKTLWGEQYNRKMSDLLATQREITTEIVKKLELKLAGEDEKKLQKTYTTDSEAYQLYLKGNFHYSKRTKANIEQAIKYFEQAINRDPNFALAYATASQAHLMMPSYGYTAPKESGPKAKLLAEKALEIDPNLAESHAAVAFVASCYEWDWEKAQREYKKAIELDPEVGQNHKLYGYHYLVPMGRLKEAIGEVERALEMEPLSIVYGSLLASTYMYDNQHDKALEQIKATEELNPNHPTLLAHLGSFYCAMGMYDEAIDLGEKWLEKDPFSQDGLFIVGFAYAKKGERRKAKEMIERFRELSKTQYILRTSVVQIYSALGEKEMAINELEKAFEERDWVISQMNVLPFFKGISDDPRFAAIAKRMGLPERKD